MKQVFILLTFICCISSCKKKPSPLENYDRATLLKNIADSVVVPAYTDFNNASNALKAAANDFTVLPNSTNLNALKTAWNNTVAVWMRCEMFNFGYANANSLNSQIGSTPANFAVIEDEIHGTNTVDESYIAATGTTRKGLAAVEYLLYGNGISEQAVIDSFTTSAFSAKRIQYLNALCAHTHTSTNAAYNDWNNGNSYTNFLSQTQLDISGSMNLLVNALVEHIEFVRKGKVGKPLGIDNGGVADPSLCEYQLAPRSIENIRENIAQWKGIYTGKTGIGLDDYLDNVGAQYNGAALSTTISQQLDVCLTKANGITVPLHSAVTLQQQQVNALYLELKKLTVLTKVDMSSNLGVVITFSDNDGD